MTSAMLSAAVSSPAAPSRRPDDVSSKAHHNKKGKGFVNPWSSWKEQSGPQIMMKIIWMRLTGKWQDPDTSPANVPTVRKPTFLPTRETDKLRATWLGHACYYVEFPSGLRVLFDPVFEERCSPFNWLGPKRYTDQPCQVDEIPFIDAVVISHNHYDHMSHPTLGKIQQRFPEAHFFVPMGNKQWFAKNLSHKHVTELDWWEERELRLSSPPAATSDDKLDKEVSPVSSTDSQKDIVATFGCLPCQHMTARTAFDRAHTLWASWSVTSGGKKLWFGGDTGYRTVPEKLPANTDFDYAVDHSELRDLPHCPAFKQIGELRGPFDLGLIPIGAYDPRFIMSPMHANPFDSVNIFADTKCERALGIHWGTWVLTSEAVMEPPELLKKALKWKGLGGERFEVCEIGESREY